MTAASPAWREVSPMNYRRSFHTLTVLPDGKVLATGGQTTTDGIDETTGVLPAEMWDPDTDTWTVMASSHRPRLYHSSAVLLPDGRVLLAGGGAYGVAKNERSGEVYSPPYLSKGPRPTVTDAPSQVHYNQSFRVDTPDAAKIKSVSFVRMGSVTHNLDMDQRYTTLPVHTNTDSVTIDGPTSTNVAPPGFYLVFLLDDKGVPSMGQIVQLGTGVDTQAPTAPSTLSVTNHTDGATLHWGASSDNAGVTGYRVYRSTTANFTPSSTNRVASVPTGTTYDDRGLPAGTYYYKVRAVDKAGNLSGDSNQAIGIVTGDQTAPTASLTAPSAGAKLSGTVTATATASDAVAVATVTFQVDGQAVGDPDITAPYTFSWDTKTVADGRHTLTAVARDSSGNTTTSSGAAVEVHNTGLVAAYSFDEASGSTVTDAVNHHDGTIVGGATRVASGRFGGALSFDGSSGRVAIPHDATLALGVGMTVEAWVRPAAGTSVSSVVMKEQPGGYTYALFANGDTNVPTGNVFTTSPYVARGPSSLTLGTWTHLAMTWDGSVLKLYDDGAEVDSVATAGALPSGTGELSIGGSSAGSQFFNGLVDNVRIYDHALAADQVRADVNAPVTP
jgi:hypothetical protein